MTVRGDKQVIYLAGDMIARPREVVASNSGGLDVREAVALGHPSQIFALCADNSGNWRVDVLTRGARPSANPADWARVPGLDHLKIIAGAPDQLGQDQPAIVLARDDVFVLIDTRGGLDQVAQDLSFPALEMIPSPALTGLLFAAGTRLQIPGGDRLVDDLTPGDLILTRDSGAQRVVSCNMRVAKDLVFVTLPAHVQGTPQGDLHLMADHGVVLRHAALVTTFGRDEILVPARHLLALPGASPAPPAAILSGFALRLATPQIIFANGVEVEVGGVDAGTLPHRASGFRGRRVVQWLAKAGHSLTTPRARDADQMTAAE